MNNSVLKDANTYNEKHRRKKRWYKIFICLAAVVVFCTTYALILPAITMERETCDIPEHTHTLECYRQITSVPGIRPVCSPERLELHQHTRQCYDYNGELICGYADFVVHQHDASCYDEDGYLWCPLPEIYTHTHTEDCYEEPVYEITDPVIEYEFFAPYDDEPTVFFDNNDIYMEEYSDMNISDEAESEESDEDALTEDESGEQDEEIYYSFPEEEYEERFYNYIDEPLIPVAPVKPVLICEIEEVILHEHTHKCFDIMGNLICGKTQVLEHYHTADCFEECEIPIDTDTLTCGLEEDENHTHTPLCYGTWELICELEEHTHTEECQPNLNLGETEESETEETETEEPESEETEEPETEEPESDEPESEEPESDELESDEPESDEPETEEPESEETETEEPESEETETEEPESEETETEEPETEETESDEPETEETETEEPESEETETEEPETEGTESEEPKSEETETEEPESEESETEEPETEEPETEEPETEEPETEEPETEETETEEPETEEPETEEPETEEPETEETETEEPETEETDEPESEDPEENKVLSDDGAYVSLLSETGSEILSERTESETITTVVSGDTVIYNFRIDTASYSDDSFTEGKVKLEFVLPLTEEQAAFDTGSMTWLDRSEGYEPSVTAETRIINDVETECQVLRGFVTVSVPGEAEINAAIKTLNLPSESEIFLQISAAMEYSSWDSICELHQTEEKLTIVTVKYAVENEQQLCYEQFKAEIEAFDASAGDADELRKRLDEAYSMGKLTEENYNELCGMLENLTLPADTSIAEAAEGENWKALRDSGWFEEYSSYSGANSYASWSLYAGERLSASSYAAAVLSDNSPPSAVQIDNHGGSSTSEDGAVTVSKTISGTELENVFDITLSVQTSTEISDIIEEPDMAVVIVMDISNTMNSDFGDVTRYAAAMDAAEDFLDQFAKNNSLGISKIGYVAFNTNAHKIFGLQSCSDETQANSLKNIMRTQTGNIINNYTKESNGFVSDHNRFTNIEAGLAMASDMLNGVSNKNKYIIFLSDGFPTTYISSGYSGYDPYDSTGARFKDRVLNKPCAYGTSYSDEAAIRARKKAAAIKNSGTTIFSIGVDVEGQTIQTYITQSEKASGHSVVDRTSTTYEIGDASSTESYKNWLRDSIGSGYYYDSTNSAGLLEAYKQIFAEIKHRVEAGSVADWVASDPLPTVNGNTDTVEFIGFYNKTPALVSGDLTGAHDPNGENTASFISSDSKINWDLKNSGYIMSSIGSTTTYTYKLVYRVRLMNEKSDFVEGTIYPTNDTTTLQYRTINNTDGNLTVSAPKTVKFQIPAVHGYLAEFEFDKIDSRGQPLAGAVFTLIHDDSKCGLCRGDLSSCVAIADMTATSASDGKVTFTNIPSGHTYKLVETVVPDGYRRDGNTYIVKVAYDKITVTVTDANNQNPTWNGQIVNQTYYELPNTGGPGIYLYTIGGLILVTGSAVLLLYRQNKRRKDEQRHY